MNRHFFMPHGLPLFLTFTLVLSQSPAFALRATGLEEDPRRVDQLQQALTAGLEENGLEQRLQVLMEQMIEAVGNSDFPRFDRLFNQVPVVPDEEGQSEAIKKLLFDIRAMRATGLLALHFNSPTVSQDPRRIAHFQELVELIPTLLSRQDIPPPPDLKKQLESGLITVVQALAQEGSLSESEIQGYLLNPRYSLPEGSVWLTLLTFFLRQMQQRARQELTAGRKARESLMSLDEPWVMKFFQKVVSAFPVALTAMDHPSQWIREVVERDLLQQRAALLLALLAEGAGEENLLSLELEEAAKAAVGSAFPWAWQIPLSEDLKEAATAWDLPNELNRAALGARMLEGMADWLGLPWTAADLHQMGDFFAYRLAREYPGHPFHGRHLFREVAAGPWRDLLGRYDREQGPETGLEEPWRRNAAQRIFSHLDGTPMDPIGQVFLIQRLDDGRLADDI